MVVGLIAPAPRLRRWMQNLHRDYVFERALDRFRADPGRSVVGTSPLLDDLIYGWGNEGWSAKKAYLRQCVERALVVDGPSLECGSGLTTILVGIVAQVSGHRHWALEHDTAWAERVVGCLLRHGIDSVTVCTGDLAKYPNFSWYSTPWHEMGEPFALVICDGPPGDTAGGRYGLVPVMKDRLRQDCVILLDDAIRSEEQAIARRWEAEFGCDVELVDGAAPFFTITFGDRQALRR